MESHPNKKYFLTWAYSNCLQKPGQGLILHGSKGHIYRGTSLQELCMSGSRLYCVTDECYVNKDDARFCSYYIIIIISVIELGSVFILKSYQILRNYEAGPNQ
jgi:hypothetical protein